MISTARGPVPLRSFTSEVISLGVNAIAAAKAAASVSAKSNDVAPCSVNIACISKAISGSSSIIKMCGTPGLSHYCLDRNAHRSKVGSGFRIGFHRSGWLAVSIRDNQCQGEAVVIAHTK
jgi:hypothetical protein